MNDSFLIRFNFNVTLILAICGVLETIFFFSIENIYASMVLILGWGCLATVCLTQRNIEKHPVSFLMIFGMAVYHYILPLPLTLIDGSPVTENLRVPVLTFSHHLLFCITITFTYWFYTVIYAGGNPFRNVLKRTIFYEVPSNKVIWVTSISALLSSFYNYFVLGLWGLEAADRDLLYYITTMLSQFIWMPLIILFPEFRGMSRKDNLKNYWYVAAYAGVLVIVAVTSNWRTVLFSGVFLVMGMLVTGLLLRFYRLSTLITPKRLICGFLVSAVVTGPFMDLAQAMVIVRHERYELSGADFLKRTIDVFNNKELLAKFKNEKDMDGGRLLPTFSYDWDEHYLSNSVLNRMVNLKISDNCLFYASEIGFGSEDMQNEFSRQIAALLPNVFLPLLGVSYDQKVESASYSIGDYLYGLATNRTTELGYWIISAMPGVGLAIFGYWYFAVVFCLFVIIFGMLDSLVVIDAGRLRFSYLFFVMLAMVLNFFNDRHVFVYEFRFVIRTYFESVVVFLTIMTIVRFLVGEHKRR